MNLHMFCYKVWYISHIFIMTKAWNENMQKLEALETSLHPLRININSP